MFIINNIKLLFYLLLINIKSKALMRGEFLLRSIFMGLNNLFFIILWWVLFTKYDTIRGWKIEYIVLMFGIASFVFGINTLFFDGLRQVPRWVKSGQFDIFFIYPRNILLTISGSSSDASGLGDVLSGIIMIILSGFGTNKHGFYIAIVLIFGIICVYAINLLLASLAFWVQDSEDLTKQLYINILILTTNPPFVYQGILKLIIFSIAPVAFINYLPIKFFKDLEFKFLLYSMLGSTIILIISLLVFFIGIRKYESGNLFIAKT